MKFKKILFIFGGIVALLIAWFVASYIVLPVFSYSSVPIPAPCTGAVSQLPSSLDYAVPHVGTGTLLTSDATSTVVVMADYGKSPLTSTAFLIRKSDNTILWQATFNNDIVDAAFTGGMLYLYNDKIGYFIDENTGEPAHFLFTFDNYRGVYASGGTQYIQTDLELSGLRADGTFVSHLRTDMKSIAFGCLIY
jgi:hypothetical protein